MLCNCMALIQTFASHGRSMLSRLWCVHTRMTFKKNTTYATASSRYHGEIRSNTKLLLEKGKGGGAGRMTLDSSTGYGCNTVRPSEWSGRFSRHAQTGRPQRRSTFVSRSTASHSLSVRQPTRHLTPDTAQDALGHARSRSATKSFRQRYGFWQDCLAFFFQLPRNGTGYYLRCIVR